MLELSRAVVAKVGKPPVWRRTATLWVMLDLDASVDYLIALVAAVQQQLSVALLSGGDLTVAVM